MNKNFNLNFNKSKIIFYSNKIMFYDVSNMDQHDQKSKLLFQF